MFSELCIYDMASAEVSVLLQDGSHIEAPNWHPDGYLVVNGMGLLYRVPLDRPRLVRIDTGMHLALNNDHGVSPDGRTLMFSDKTATMDSCIYRTGIEGGRPVRVTAEVPSWYHGWSPDGARITYVAARRRADGQRGRILPYTANIDGSDERCLVEDFDHVDGTDYTPDGEWIWFNGERGGAVDLWRIRPDGTGLERMTDDAAVNWFPHPSPDGQHVLYLAYPPGTRGHPRNLDVSLRMMPAAGGPTWHLTSLYGGQGTINVPCWAPDSHAFAFMRYVD